MKPSSRYRIQAVAHAAEVLKTFRMPEEHLSLSVVIERSGVPKGIAFRILHTLAEAGILQRAGRGYRSLLVPESRRRYRIGYASQGAPDRFVAEVTDSLKAAAARLGDVDLLLFNNQYSTSAASRNVERFLLEEVELVIEYQTDVALAPRIASRLRSAGVPVIAIDIPHPGATYFGANNYEAGMLAGRHLGKWAMENWNGKVDRLLLLDLPRAGAIAQARLSGIAEGVRAALRGREPGRIISLPDANGEQKAAYRATQKFLKQDRNGATLIAGINDPSVIGALHAFQELSPRARYVGAGQGGSPEGRAELRANPRFLASVAYFPERYGAAILSLAIDMLNGKPVPQAVFTPHRLLTAANVDRIYANDALLA